MLMLDKPWIVYIREGKFANTLSKFHSEQMAKRRLRDILKRNPEMRGKVGVYRKRLMTRLIA
jgi:hypothetical protein